MRLGYCRQEGVKRALKALLRLQNANLAFLKKKGFLDFATMQGMKRLVLDLETKRSFNEVGGSHNKHLLGVSLVGTYHYNEDKFIAYREESFAELAKILKEAELLIGFNLIGFDWPVLAAELGDWVKELPTLDLMFEAQKALGHRISLDALAQATLGMNKIGSGLDALYYYAEGNWEKLERYCLEDVKITRDLYEYAKTNHILYYQKGNKRAPIPMSFSKNPLSETFEQVTKNKGSVKMTYASKERLVDVQAFDGFYIKGYCHLRREVLTFRLDRVEKVEVVSSSIPLF